MVPEKVGGLLYGIGRAIPFWFDAASYLFAIVTAALIRSDIRPRSDLDPAAQSPKRSGFARDMGDGMRVVLGDAFLRAVLVIAPLVNFALTGAVFALTVVLRQSGFDAGLVGGANAVFAVGGLVGAMLAPRLIARMKIAPLIRLAILVTVASVGVEAILAGTLFMAVPLVVAALFAPAFNAALFTRIGLEVPAKLQGRVLSVVILLATASAALAPAATGLLLHITTAGAAIGLLTGLLVVASIASFTLSGLRRATSPYLQSD